MSKAKTTTIEVQGAAITVLSQKEQDFICLTDMAKKFGDDILDLQLDAESQHARIHRRLGANPQPKF